MTDVRMLTKERFLSMFRDTEDVKRSSVWKILVIDDGTTDLISDACTMYDITEENVTTVEALEKKRRKFPDMEAVYFISPTAESVQLLNDDFADRSEPQYRCIHLFFPTKLPNVLFQQLSERTVSRIKSMAELNLNYRAPEARVFHFNDPSSIYSIYTGEGREADQVFRSMAKQMMTVCASLGENPYIRYHENSDLCMSLASILQDQLDSFVDENEGLLTQGEDRATLLILERGQDLIVPLLHDFYYQNMAYDMLPIKGYSYSYDYVDNDDQEQVREAVLSEEDPVWVRLRHMHIAEACDVVIKEFNEFLQQNKAINTIDNKQKVSNLKQMTEAVRAMPKYQEMKKKYALHMDMASSCMDEFEARKLAEIAAVEQDIACGEDPLGKVMQPKHMLPRLKQLLSNPDISEEDKMRVLLIAQLEGMVHAEDRRALMAEAGFSNETKMCLYKLQRLVTEEIKYTKPKPVKKKKKTQEDEDAVPYELSRWQPALRHILKEVHEDVLPRDTFVFVKDAPPQKVAPVTPVARSLKAGGRSKASHLSDEPAWMRSKDGEGSCSAPTGPRLIVFILGGYTFPEVRQCYELSRELNRDIIIGGNYHTTPPLFMSAIKSLP